MIEMIFYALLTLICALIFIGIIVLSAIWFNKCVEEQRKIKEIEDKLDSMEMEGFDAILEDCGIDRIKPSEESDYVKATMIDDRPACCIYHDVYVATCDTCEFGLED